MSFSIIENKIKFLSIFFVLFLFSTLLILIVPKSQDTSFTTNEIRSTSSNIVKPDFVYLNKYMSILIDVDSDEMLGLANDPSQLFNQKNQRQARPMLIYTAHIISKPLNFIFTTLNLDKKININLDGENTSKKIKNSYKIPIFFSYVLINYFILLLSVILFINICLYHKINLKTILLFLPFLTLNICTKYFLLCPHFQMFNILCPLLGCYIFQIINTKSNINYLNILIMSFSLGFLLLFYGIFIVLLPIFILSLIFNKDKIINLIQKIFFTSIVFFIPSIIWSLYLRILGTEIYFHETKQKMLIWIFDLKLNNFLSIIFTNFIDFFKTFNVQYFVLASILYLFFKNKNNLIEYLKKVSPFIIVFLIIFCFLYLVGFYKYRLSVNLIIPLILIFLTLIRFDQKKMEFFLIYTMLLCVNFFYFIKL